MNIYDAIMFESDLQREHYISGLEVIDMLEINQGELEPGTVVAFLDAIKVFELPMYQIECRCEDNLEYKAAGINSSEYKSVGINKSIAKDILSYFACKAEFMANKSRSEHVFCAYDAAQKSISSCYWEKTELLKIEALVGNSSLVTWGEKRILRRMYADILKNNKALFLSFAKNAQKGIKEFMRVTAIDGDSQFDDIENVLAIKQLNNNSLASYMTEYTLPQVVALILHIDLADITTNSSNSYINNQDNYDEAIYQKFENLLQSYSVAALNNKLDGMDVFTQKVNTYSGEEDHINLEKTIISRDNLASYLDTIGYQLDDLIAKQEPVHTRHNSYQRSEDEAEAVLLLRQQIEDLQAQLKAAESKENSLVIESESASIELGKYQKLLMGYPLLTAHQIACLLSNHNPVGQDYHNDDSYKLYKEMTDTAIDGRLLTVFNEKGHIAIEEVKVWLASNDILYKGFNEDWLENACEEEEDILVKMNNQFNDIVHYLREINEKKEEDIEQLASEYEELKLECEELVKQNKDIRESLEQYKQGDNEELAQHGEDESKKYKSRIEELEDQLKKAQDDSKEVPHQAKRTVTRVMYAMAKLTGLDNSNPYSRNVRTLNEKITTTLQNDGLKLEYQAVGKWLTEINEVQSAKR